MKKSSIIPSVNYHLWEPCNMRCKFCFATFHDMKKTILPKGHLPEEKAIELVKKLANFGFEKITFAGGEPTLCPWLSELIQTAKTAGMATMIVTNGSNLSERFLMRNKGLLDWITLSIDSLNQNTNLLIGRAIVGKKAISRDQYQRIIDRVKSYGYKIKVNTVVNRFNVTEDINSFISTNNIVRWKVLQVLPIKGENDKTIDRFMISTEEFSQFLEKHKELRCLVPENNNQMTNTYAMIDPAGRFFNNENNVYCYSEPILKVGVKDAFQSMNYNLADFIKRGGIYDWTNS